MKVPKYDALRVKMCCFHLHAYDRRPVVLSALIPHSQGSIILAILLVLVSDVLAAPVTNVEDTVASPSSCLTMLLTLGTCKSESHMQPDKFAALHMSS